MNSALTFRGHRPHKARASRPSAESAANEPGGNYCRTISIVMSETLAEETKLFSYKYYRIDVFSTIIRLVNCLELC